jgi:hypothetical protein
VALLVLRGGVVAWAGQAGGGLVDLGEVEGEVGGDVGVVLVDAGVQNGDADACAQGGVPGTGGGAAGDVGAVASGLADGPALRGGVVGVIWGGRRGRRRRWWWGRWWWGGDADGGGDYGAEDERVGGDDAVVDDELDVGLGAEGCDGCGFIGAGCGVEDGNTKGLVEAEDAGVGEADVGLGVAGDGVVAVGDEVAVRDGCSEGAGELLGG